MNRALLLLALVPALAACASTGDYPGARPAPIAPVAVAPELELELEPELRPFIVTAPGPGGPATPYHVVQTPMGATVTPGVLTTGPYRPVRLQ